MEEKRSNQDGSSFEKLSRKDRFTGVETVSIRRPVKDRIKNDVEPAC